MIKLLETEEAVFCGNKINKNKYIINIIAYGVSMALDFDKKDIKRFVNNLKKLQTREDEENVRNQES